MSFKVAQTFYVDKSMVRGAENVSLSSVDIYFKSKPRATANMSGITNPGVTLYLVETKDDDVPDVNRVLNTGTARCEYNQIVPSSDASIKTTFTFSKPVIIQSNKSYAIVLAYDGSEEFKAWTCKEGETIVKTNTITAGATARNVGKYFEYTVGSGTIWKSLSNTDLKFSVFVAKYVEDVTSATVTNTYVLPSDAVEYIMYDRYSAKTRVHDQGVVGEMIFQETPVIYGSVKVNSTSNNVTVAAGNINFSQLFTAPTEVAENRLSIDPVVGQKRYIVLRNGSSQLANVDVVEVISVASNTELVLIRPPKFTNPAATFSVTAAGKLNHRDRHFHTGRWFNASSNTMVRHVARKADILRLVDSNANSTVRFVNNMVEGITVVSGGTGYSNSDIITVYPVLDANTANAAHIAYIPSYANAVANVVTNGAGTITGIAITKAGFGLASNVAIQITTTAGTAANIVPQVGSTLRGATSNAYYGDCVVTNVPVHRSFPQVKVLSNHHHTTRVIQHFPYYIKPNLEHVLTKLPVAMKREVNLLTNNGSLDLDNNDGRVFVLASRSNEVAQSSNVTIQLANGANFATKLKSSSILEMPIVSNNAFTVPTVEAGQVYNYTYIINNTDVGERKGNGKALARHISEKVTFSENRNAEDIVVYCDAYRPAGTGIKVYARLHNRTDQEAFDDKDWTELVLKSNNASLTSSLTNEKDLIEFTYGLPNAPTSVNTIAGDATVTISQSNAVGVGTSWTTDLQVNDVIKIYDKLFPENYMITVVRGITNNTFITLDDASVNSNLSGKIDLIGRKANGANTEIGSPFQAFIYGPNESICRYYDSNMSKKDTYNTFAIKVVLTSNNDSIVPKVWNTRAVGVSA